ncbi:MAG: PhaM family polyhydroxyalkanoate granule multifunctional regulatory protein [Betaproteobacteria bacterium]
MAAAHDFSKMVPGFDFLQGLVKNASSALPSLGQWVAPTLDPEELGKRIEELKTVQFWLEQNARMIGTTVQALEVQRMTLTTLKTMNVQAADLAQAFKLKEPAPASKSAPEPRPAPAPAPEAAPAPTPSPSPAQASAASGAAGPGVVDPKQWWGALTQQFTQLAAQALKDKPADSPAATGPKSAGAAGRAAQAGTARKTTPKSARKTARTSPAGKPAGGRAAQRKA